MTGIPQGSVVDPLFFNIFIDNLIYIRKQSDVCNVAGDNAVFSCSDSVQVVASCFEEDISKSVFWLIANQMVMHASKFDGSNLSLVSK